MAEKKYFDENGLLYYDNIIKNKLDKKVDKVEGMGLSHNDLTDELKQKILDAGTGSFTGNYDDLLGIPTLDNTPIKGTLTKSELNIAKASDLLQTDGDLANAMADIEEIQQAGYQTASDVESILSSKNYATESFVTNKGYQTKEQVDARVEEVIGSAPEVLDTLEELAKALGDDPNFAATITEELGKKVNEADLVPISNEEIEQIVNPS